MIVNRNTPTAMTSEPQYDEDDVRCMSPRRNSTEVDRLSEAARQDLRDQAKVLQTSLQDIVDKIERVKSEQEKLEAGNKFLQSYGPLPVCSDLRRVTLIREQIYRRAHANIQDHRCALKNEGQRAKREVRSRRHESMCSNNGNEMGFDELRLAYQGV
jgi:hypothetical protein